MTPGEEVRAAVAVQTPGTAAAGTAGAVAGAHAGAVGSPLTVSGAGGGEHALWVAQAERAGIDPTVAKRTVWAYAALTSRRLLVVRRSRLTGRPREIVAAWSLDAVDTLSVPGRARVMTVGVGDTLLRFELPAEHKFLPDVYRELPARWAAARDELTA